MKWLEIIDDTGRKLYKCSVCGEIQHNVLNFKGCPCCLSELGVKPKGKWLNNMNGTFTCGKCKTKSSKTKYCGNCGAEMED